MVKLVLRVFGTIVALCALVADSKDGKVAAQVKNPWLEQEPNEPTLAVYEDEDAASAAQRTAAERGMYESEPIIMIAKAWKAELQDIEDFTIPKGLILMTGGKYMKRAEEFIKEKKFAAAVADCLRALMRPGLDPTATEPMTKRLDYVLLRMQRIKEMAEEEARGQEEKYAVHIAETDALAKEWEVILAEDGQLWREIDNSSAFSQPAKVPKEKGKEVAGVDLNMKSSGGEKSLRAKVHEGEDGSHSAFHFCAANGIHDVEEVSKISGYLTQDMQKNNYEAPQHLQMQSAADHLKQGQSLQEEFELGHAGAHYVRGLQAQGATDEEKEDLKTRLLDVLKNHKSAELFRPAWAAKDYQAVINSLKELPASLRSDAVQLILARAYQHSGKVKEALASITSLLNQCDKSGDWLVSEPRLIAAVSGATLALQVGDIEKAKKMYQIVLRNDPEQAHVKKRYKALRGYMKHLTDIEELLNQSKNHDVVKVVDIVQKMLVRVLGEEGAKHAGTRLLLFECKAKSAMTFHDDAIEACNTAIKQFENHDNPDPRRIAEAYAWRAEANRRDNSFDDAVADMQVALTKNPNKKEYQEMLQSAKEEQDNWNKSEEQHGHRGEKHGVFYVNRPIKQMLDLPDNIDELDKETKCKYLKSNFRKMSLRWHPDKAVGGKARAQRKSAEIGEGKGLLEIQWGCKGKRR